MKFKKFRKQKPYSEKNRIMNFIVLLFPRQYPSFLSDNLRITLAPVECSTDPFPYPFHRLISQVAYNNNIADPSILV